MLHKNDENRVNQVQMVSIDSLVPKNHLLRKIDETIDFSFIYDLIEDKYCLDNGRPSIDPIVLFKIIFLKYIFGIKSMRQTIREIEVNVAYRWFLGYDFYDKIPHFTTYGQNYKRRFKDTDIFEKIFVNILRQAEKQGFVDEKIQFVDSTHVKAHANRHKNIEVKIEKKAKKYHSQLNEEIKKDRELKGKKELSPTDGKEIIKKVESTTDKESGLFHKGEHKEVFAYSVQTSCDKNGWVLACRSYAGNLHDSETFMDFYEKDLKKFELRKIVMDAGYKTPAIAKMLIDDKIQPVLPYTSPKGKRKEGFYPKDYVYDEYYDCYICPENEILKYSTTTREGYREYKSDRNKCSKCKNLDKCTESKNKQKVITRHIWKNYLEECEEYRYTKRGKEEYKRRKETIERTFGTVKEYHGFRYTNEKGKAKMQIKALLTFACLNMKKLANMMSKLGRKRPNFLIFREIYIKFKILINSKVIFN